MEFLRSFLKKLFLLLIGYIFLFFLVKLFIEIVFPLKGITIHILTTPDVLSIMPVFLISIILTFSALIYVFNSLLERRWVRLRFDSVLLFMGLAAALGPTGEILINTVSHILFGQGVWVYQLLPVHGGNTSMVMSVIWPLYGFHIYCFHKALLERGDKNEDSDLALFIGMDAITLEVLVNLFSTSFFYTYVFYYFAGDLYHFSTAVILIPYILCGFLGIKLLHFLEKKHHRIFWGIAGFAWSWIIIFVL